MATDPIFDTFHKYNRLVRRGLTRPLTCDCGEEVVTVLGFEDTLMLQCFGCDTLTSPGTNTIDNVTAIVKEHFL